MAKNTILNADSTLTGGYGFVMHEGVYLSNVKDVEAKVEIEKADFKVVGDLWGKSKVTGFTGSGTLTLIKVDYKFVKKIAEVAAGGKAFVTELVVQIDDPSTTQAKEKVRLKNVQFDSIPLVKFTVGEIIEEELTFTFEGFDID